MPMSHIHWLFSFSKFHHGIRHRFVVIFNLNVFSGLLFATWSFVNSALSHSIIFLSMFRNHTLSLVVCVSPFFIYLTALFRIMVWKCICSIFLLVVTSPVMRSKHFNASWRFPEGANDMKLWVFSSLINIPYIVLMSAASLSVFFEASIW